MIIILRKFISRKILRTLRNILFTHFRLTIIWTKFSRKQLKKFFCPEFLNFYCFSASENRWGDYTYLYFFQHYFSEMDNCIERAIPKRKVLNDFSLLCTLSGIFMIYQAANETRCMARSGRGLSRIDWYLTNGASHGKSIKDFSIQNPLIHRTHILKSMIFATPCLIMCCHCTESSHVCH